MWLGLSPSLLPRRDVLACCLFVKCKLLFGTVIKMLSSECQPLKIIILFLIVYCFPQIPISALVSFVEALEVGYSKHKNPYHNLMHAADVTQTVHYLLFKTGVVVSRGIDILNM